MNDDGIKKLFDRMDVLEVADLRNLTKHLWKQREFFRKTFEFISDSIVVINSQGEIAYCNASARNTLGITNLKQYNILWKYIPEFVTFSELRLLPEDENTTFLCKEIKISYPRKAILSVSVSHNCDYYDDDEKMFVLRISDVTEDRASSEKLISEEKISSIMLLASGVAHEIGNPLNAISLRLELMKRQIHTLKDRTTRVALEKSTKICIEEIARLDSIVRNLLHAIRPQRPNMTELNLAEVIRSSIELMDAEFKSLNIKVVNNIPTLPTVLGDKNQLKQVFFNILKNSCEAISESGSIIIEGSESDSEVTITLFDNGSGISCEIFDKIFTPYFSTKPTGSGLGMMIVRRILSDHGGTIDIASAENAGTKISINLPRKDKRIPLLHTEVYRKNP